MSVPTGRTPSRAPAARPAASAEPPIPPAPRRRTATSRRRRTYLPADARKAQILEHAKAVFAHRGYHGANVAHICAAARIGRGTLYQYFENKRAVMIALLEAVEARIQEVLAARQLLDEARLKAAAPGRKGVAMFCVNRLRELLRAVFIDEQTLRLIVREARGVDFVLAKALDRIDAGILTALEHDLMVAQRARIIRSGNPIVFARYILGGIEKVILTALLKDEPVDLDEIVHQCVQMELFGLYNAEETR
jgi:AcrR family transcriptional regulator